MGKHEDALSQYENAIRVDGKPPNKGQFGWRGYFRIADLMKTLSDFSQAMRAYDMAHSLAPKEVFHALAFTPSTGREGQCTAGRGVNWPRGIAAAVGSLRSRRGGFLCSGYPRSIQRAGTRPCRWQQ
jgi:hypothetical protein